MPAYWHYIRLLQNKANDSFGLSGKSRTIGFGQMPAFKDKLADEEVEAVLAYIKTWWTIEQQADQADISKRYQDALDRQKKGQ